MNDSRRQEHVVKVVDKKLEEPAKKSDQEQSVQNPVEDQHVEHKQPRFSYSSDDDDDDKEVDEAPFQENEAHVF
jgi:hypothetical protein